MRIAYFNATLKEGQDGVARVIYKFFDEAKKRGVEAIAFGATLPPENQRVIPMVKVRSVKFPLHKAYSLALPDQGKLARDLDKFNPSIIHINSPCTLGFSAMRYAQKRNIPIVATYHTHFPTYLTYYKLRGLEEIVWKIMQRLYNGLDRTFVPTPGILEELSSHGIKHLEHLPNGIDTTEFNPSHFSDQWRAGVDGRGKTLLLFVSRLVWEKNIKILADTYNLLKSNRNDFSMVVIGDGHAKSELEKMMKGAFFLGFQRGETLAKAYASSDIFLFPSTTETFGLVTVEAMASGLVPVAAKAGGATGFIHEGINGFLTPPHDARGMAAKVEWLLDHPEARRNLASAAIKSAGSFDWDVIIDRLFAGYEDIIDGVKNRRFPRAA